VCTPSTGLVGSPHIQNASLRAWRMPLARTAASGASQCAGWKSSLKTRFTFTPNIGLESARAAVAGVNASASTASSKPLRPIA
jgi:hypothetical protein